MREESIEMLALAVTHMAGWFDIIVGGVCAAASNVPTAEVR